MPTSGAPQGGGLISKRRAILSGALREFARDGYARASVDAIAASAGVSTRTIYNHFGDKATLFEAVIQASAEQVADTHIEEIERHLAGIGSESELEPALVACWVAVLRSVPADSPHWSLVRHVQADVAHIPETAIAAWRRAGPQRVQRELAHHLRSLADRGYLQIPDAVLAATHLSVLVGSDHSRIDETETEALVAAGVHVFLHGYQPGETP